MGERGWQDGRALRGLGVTVVPEATIQAYLSTRYIVFETPVGPLELRVGHETHGWSRLMAALGQTSGLGVFVTAYNPRGVTTAAPDNEQAQAALCEELARRGLVNFAGEGRGVDTGLWPPEPSRLVVGMTMDEAHQIGTRFQQNAVVVQPMCGAAELILLR